MLVCPEQGTATAVSKTINAIRGMNDILPADTPLWQEVEDVMRAVLQAYGYAEIRLPIVEHTELFERVIGEATEVVEKEMYTFADRNGDSLTLRPEGTAGCVRAAIQHHMLRGQAQKLWYAGPMFRHERPQRGRYRQFHQVGAEALGLEGPDVDLELILLCARLWRELGLEALRLELNTLGVPEERARHRSDLVAYFQDHREALDDDGRRRLESNPLRILDSKNPQLQSLIDGAPQLIDYVGGESREHFERLCAELDAAGQPYEINPRLVRGLDYYSRTVFEWTTDRLGAQATVCGGGRYDGLVQQLGGPATPAIGFSLGVERLLELLRETRGEGPTALSPHAYVVVAGAGLEGAAQRVAEGLRDDLPGLRVQTHLGGGSLKSQFRRADRSGARVALVLGEDEHAAGEVTVKPLREDGMEQVRIAQDRLTEHCAGLVQLTPQQ